MRSVGTRLGSEPTHLRTGTSLGSRNHTKLRMGPHTGWESQATKKLNFGLRAPQGVRTHRDNKQVSAQWGQELEEPTGTTNYGCTDYKATQRLRAHHCETKHRAREYRGPSAVASPEKTTKKSIAAMGRPQGGCGTQGQAHMEHLWLAGTNGSSERTKERQNETLWGTRSQRVRRNPSRKRHK